MPSLLEIAEHNTHDDCWVVIHGKAYDVTGFLDEHPGGSAIIMKFAGKDATKKFDPIHPPDTLDKFLSPECYMGEVEDEAEEEEEEELTEEELARAEMVTRKPSLDAIYNLTDFEHVARHTMDPTAWAYYSSGSDDEITMRENRNAYQRIFFRPRIMVDVSKIDMSTTMLGCKTSVPFYITATALGKLGHPDGETVLTRAAGKEGVIQMIPTLASCAFDEIVDAADGTQTQWFQLYVNADRAVCRKLVEHAEARGVRGLFITVDAPQLGRREKDMRSKHFEETTDVQQEEEEEEKIDRLQGAARAISSFIDTSLSWKDVAWFRSITKMPILLKGVQSVDDALLAAEHGCDGIVLSNHGGRQLEFAPSAIEILTEVMPALRARGVDTNKFQVYVDGGVRRGSDIIKAICLGAKGVGLGRLFLYAMSTYGEQGVRKAINILQDEIEMNMRLLGVTSIAQLSEKYVDVLGLKNGRGVPEDYLFREVYQPMALPRFKSKL
ncbi:hypothetical protein BABINDRAFT_161727 [Babjeviella inositovora NRRL Y-12698]|uniref:L-lactate dehydrogenase (cytochrome) n=1 Tax=Babjeviella inositovora NRRL Y-12698 TaxID=984486 RepID=A0A1E3QNN0_9ASCO|nr:uncharacterized protein BABINDRAFT_161727 [Babjeviella inositovora NRRL Y-12698]ODQ79316.1 hypothetical protein BABINDRAFT_161727 [Babjeviella inositovora NRRL Y-12698]